MYAKRGSINDAQILFEFCPTLDPVSCNIMVRGYVKAGQLDNARKLFDRMPDKGCVSYTTMIMGLVQNVCFREALVVFKDSSVSLHGTEDELDTGCGAHDVDVLGAESVAHAADANSDSEDNADERKA
ncbi:hypothetical protein VIGAN_08038300 [Vigna angularis var. angularis]|nr:hypothetical protein VIGAN_08038300 [Vigna angularis var. angularis]